MRFANALFVIIAGLLLAGAGRLAYLEQARGAELRRKAERQHTAQTVIPALRGEILDTRGRVLAGSVRRPSIFADPSNVEDPRFAAESFALVLGLDARALEQLLRERRESGFVWVKRDVSPSERAEFEKVRTARRLYAFDVQDEPWRTYPLGRVAAHVLGFVGKDQHGLAGVEQACDAVLAGRDGRRRSTVDVQRRRLLLEPEDFTPPQDGASVVLTIDAHIQQRVEAHLRNAVTQHKAVWGTAVVMDPQTGEVLGMATIPDFDPLQPIPEGLDARQRARSAELLRNRGVSDSYEPGSIFKPFIIGEALQLGLTRLDETFVINGPARSFGRRIIHDTHTYTALPLWEVISKSSNIGAAMVGGRLGNDLLHACVRRFGFGDPTGILLPGEHAGQVRDFSRWDGYSTHSIPIGQEIAVTPIQVVTAFSVFANGGILYRPRIIRGIVGPGGETIADYSRPVAIRRVLDAQVADRVRREALVETVHSGTGKRAALPDHQAFGKTGTAQIGRPDGRGYIPNKYTGSMLAGAPSDNPRAVVIVSVFMPSGGAYYGGTVAAPTAGAILADTLAYMQVPPEPRLEEPRELPEVLGD